MSLSDMDDDEWLSAVMEAENMELINSDTDESVQTVVEHVIEQLILKVTETNTDYTQNDNSNDSTNSHTTPPNMDNTCEKLHNFANEVNQGLSPSINNDMNTISFVVADIIERIVSTVSDTCSVQTHVTASDTNQTTNDITKQHITLKTISTEFTSSDDEPLINFIHKETIAKKSDDEPLISLKKQQVSISCDSSDDALYEALNDPMHATPNLSDDSLYDAPYDPINDEPNSTDSEYSRQSSDSLLSPTKKVKKQKKRKGISLTKSRDRNRHKHDVPLNTLHVTGRLIETRQEHAQRLENLLKANDVELIRVSPDGNCFFEAASYHIASCNGQQLRKILCNELESGFNHYVEFIKCTDINTADIDENELYLNFFNNLEELKIGGKWCNDVADLLPLVLAEWTHRPVIIYTSKATQPVISISPNVIRPDSEPITLALIASDGLPEHYNVCFKIRTTKYHITSETNVNVISKSPAATMTTTLEHSNTGRNQSSESIQENMKTPCKSTETPHENPHVTEQGKGSTTRTPRKRALFITPPKKKLFRKTYATPENWKSNVRKRLRLHGQEYINSKGQRQAAKSIKSIDCSKCRYKCSGKITDEQRQQLFVDFYNLTTYERQKDFICSNVNEKVTRTHLDSNMEPVPQKRKVARQYSFSIEGTRVKVCKAFFTSTLDVGVAYIDHAMSKSSHGVFTGIENRGRHTPVNKTRNDKLEFVREHIHSFPVVESHYTRSKTKRSYLQEGLNISKMYTLYLECCSQNNKEPVSKGIYRKYFNDNFNLSFHVPKKDQCIICTKYQRHLHNKTIQQDLEQEYIAHQARKIKAREQKNKDKEQALTVDSMKVVCFDLEAVLSTPCTLVSQAFYKRKLSGYNLSVYSLDDKHGYNYVWNETNAKRGSCEIATCIFLYLSSLPVSINHAVLYSDSCTGQNRNKYVATALLHLVKTNQHLEVVDHKFLETGHTQMECDSMHSAIEFAKKTTSVYVPSQWDTIIRMARRRNPYQVIPLTHTDIINFKMVSSVIMKNSKISTRGQRVNWMQIKWLQFRKASPTSVFFKYDFDENDFQEMNCIGKSRRGKQPQAINCLPKRYSSKLPISEAKKKDLIDLCKSGVIPEEYHGFYLNLLSDNLVKDNLPAPDIDETDGDTDDD